MSKNQRELLLFFALLGSWVIPILLARLFDSIVN